jgi:hypothetical protein
MRTENTVLPILMQVRVGVGVTGFCIFIVAAGENENDFNHSGLYSNKTVMVIIIKIYDRAKFLPVTTCKQNPS